MAVIWLALAVAVVATIASAVFATQRGLEAFRGFKRIGGSVSAGTVQIEASAAQIEEHLRRAAESGEQLDAEVTQLRNSLAQLNVLTAAIDDVRDAVGRVTSVYPRK
jgi:hypothetical protein